MGHKRRQMVHSNGVVESLTKRLLVKALREFRETLEERHVLA